MNIFIKFWNFILNFLGIKKDEPDFIYHPPREFKSNKYALLVGINKYAMPGADLNGCVNDVNGMKGLLSKYFGFNPINMRILTDQAATRAEIINGLDWLVSKSGPGVELMFHYSGHGSQVVDRNGDEYRDQLDEILCPYDLDWDHPLTDDILHDKFKQTHKESFLTMVCDSCHSGSMTRELKPPGVGCSCGDDCECKTKSKFLPPPPDVIEKQMKAVNWQAAQKKVNKMGAKQDGANQRHVLLSGCKDNQTSADAYINNKYQGALTAHLLRSITLNPTANWFTIHRKTVNMLKKARFPQDPQLSGADDLLNRTIFGG